MMNTVQWQNCMFFSIHTLTLCHCFSINIHYFNYDMLLRYQLNWKYRHQDNQVCFKPFRLMINNAFYSVSKQCFLPFLYTWHNKQLEHFSQYVFNLAHLCLIRFCVAYLWSTYSYDRRMSIDVRLKYLLSAPDKIVSW